MVNRVVKKSDEKQGTVSKTDKKKEIPTNTEPIKNSLSKIQGFLEKKTLNYEILDEQTLVVPYEIDGKLFKPSVKLAAVSLRC